MQSHLSRFNLFNLSRLPLSISTMAASTGTTRALYGAHYLTSLTFNNGFSNKQSSVFYGDRSLESCGKVRMSLKSRDSNNVFVGYLLFDTMRRSFSGNNPFVGPREKGFHTSSSTSYVSGPASDAPPSHGGTQDEEIGGSAGLSDQKISSNKSLRLVSGSCYLPHPDKEDTGGEDAHFICADEQAIGVADGVGGWADVGVNAGLFARELISHSVAAIQDEPKGSIDPARVLERAHSSTKARGSSTACIIALTGQGIHAINLGDSGFVVIRDGHVVFESPVQQHGFNFTYQLESGTSGDLPSSGQVFTIPVAPGDVIVAGTDGLFDNLYKEDITTVIVHAARIGLDPQVTAEKIAALARQRALDKKRQSPFSTAAQEAGFRYYGGKLDDITVVVSYVATTNNT